jgi:DNA-binding GntR family transcriptional regulator
MSTMRPYRQVLTFLMEIIEQSNYATDYKMPSERMLAVKFKASRRSIRLA